MNASKGYFSLVQYCPDIARQEAANVGVVLFCPERQFIEARLTRSNSRIRKFFGEDADGNKHLNAMKNALVERLKVEESSFVSLEDFQTFIATRANKVILTPARPVKVFDPEADLTALYSEFIDELPKSLMIRDEISVQDQLEQVLLAQDVLPYIRTRITVHVPALREDLEMPFGYQNGRFNLIQPVEFKQRSKTRMRDAACKTAIEGLSLYNHSDPQFGDLQLVVVANFEESNPETESLVKGILSEGSVEMFTSETLDELKREILTNGKLASGVQIPTE